jgi:DNA-binding transcriptional ArsR family regulator
VAPYQSLLDVLGDPTRRSVFERVAHKPQSVGELAASFGAISRPAVSQHLRLLADAGLVAFDKVGTRNVYRATPEGLQPLEKYLETLRGTALLGLKRESLAAPRRKPKK